MKLSLLNGAKIFAGLFLTAQAGVCFAQTAPTGAPSNDDIYNFHQTDATLYRGGRPTEAGVAWLKDNGIKTVINLEDVQDVISEEQSMVEQAGMKFESHPMGSWSDPKDSEVNAIEAAINDPANQPVFVHCHHGENRTGMIIAIHRVETDKWAAQKAYDEMMGYGFSMGGSWSLLPYFEKRTSFKPH